MRYEIMNRLHLAEISEMYVEAFNAPPWNDKWTVDLVTKRLSQMMNCEGFYGLLCFDNNELCGMILGNHEVFFDCMHFNIKEFCVQLNFREKGVGSALLQEFEAHLLERGIGQTYLFTSKTDKTETFYQNRDYKSWNNMVMMGKCLSE
ncbi:MAG: GNAT family N-acetyltransferase [Defluviitaleaceae bacterium]|nr:GNAT family N-acetyltransferase [Defluviitaleaceae bacterium]